MSLARIMLIGLAVLAFAGKIYATGVAFGTGIHHGYKLGPAIDEKVDAGLTKIRIKQQDRRTKLEHAAAKAIEEEDNHWSVVINKPTFKKNDQSALTAGADLTRSPITASRASPLAPQRKSKTAA